jgi:mono/diheme cytochrome c family protein
MASRVTWCLVLLAGASALVIGAPYAFGSRQLVQASAVPGNAAAGKKIFVEFCGKCHTMQAAGSNGTLGPNLDQDKVDFTRVVTAIEEGVGGIQAEYVLRSVTFGEVYDVARFVVSDRSG